MSTNILQSTSDQTANRCRYGLFVRINFPEVKKFPNNLPTWYYRGDKFTLDENKMLINLVKMFINHHNKYQIAELYDNNKDRNDPARIIIRFKAGIVEENRLQNYSDALNKIILPPYLKT